MDTSRTLARNVLRGRRVTLFLVDRLGLARRLRKRALRRKGRMVPRLRRVSAISKKLEKLAKQIKHRGVGGVFIVSGVTVTGL